MYVRGAPGTGKTATVMEVIKSLQFQSEQKNLPEFQVIEINGMRLTDPQHAYVHIYHQLSGSKVSWERAQLLLKELFTTPGLERKPTVLVVDEFDSMKSHRQDVIYNLLDWATKKTAQLFAVAVGNIINLELSGNISSRLGAARLTFQPYAQNQLQKIMQARLAGTNIFENDAIELVARWDS